MTYQPIESYGIIGDMNTVALVGLNGSIDWFCFPYIDSPSVFGALLDDRKGGRFLIQPTEDFDSVAEYVHRTNVLVTRFRTRTGIMELIDFMTIPPLETKKGDEQRVLYRIASINEGHMEIRALFEPRFDYARASTTLTTLDGGVIAEGAGQKLVLRCSAPIENDRARAVGQWFLKAGETLCFRIDCGCEQARASAVEAEKAKQAARQTEQYWRDWLDKSETGRIFSLGGCTDMVERSALTLKLLYYEPTGTISAAATTSLPETIGGVRNWDYRFTWMRDTSFTLRALFNLGHLSEMQGYLHWLQEVLSEGGVGTLQIMYGLRGERDIEEVELSHLDGYKGSRPVRIGNSAYKQRQLDIYGELMDSALELANYAGKITVQQWPALRQICDHVVDHWQERDFGIWEVRNGPWNFVYSKVMCWVALDRGLTIAKSYGFEADIRKWREVKEQIRRDVLEKGFNQAKNAFVQHYETDALDASNLLIPMVGFLPFDDPRIVSTVDTIANELARGGLLYRYSGEDGLKGKEGAFLLCAFWLVDCFIHMGRLEEAESLLGKLEGTANHLGLFAEEYDIEWNQALGNFPQAFTHLGYVNSIVRLIQAKEERRREQQKEKGTKAALGQFVKKRVPIKVVLNEGQPDSHVPMEDIAAKLKSTMNLLRGAFFDISRGCVAYELMHQSPLYGRHKEIAGSLQRFDPGSLTSREERIAFWLNLYNVIVVHGVIELDVRDSVREVTGFFRRIQYNIGHNLYSPDDIEHGILRANRKPPHSLFHVFGRNDERRKYSLEQLDPRIHFALVCASSSCPPIDVYTAENLDKELDQAGKTFLNGGGLSVNKKQKKVSLSRVLLWYGNDFKPKREERLRWLADYLYDPEDREFLKAHADDLTVEYQKYDWRLNRG
ncbi:MAG: hypothetical protein Kow0099_34060 [Candidatus Abyssubacteria bacterium]